MPVANHRRSSHCKLMSPLKSRSEESVRTAARTVGQAFGGKLDILINNAGYLPEFKFMTASGPADWRKGM
ncbi:hypothetical protein N7476_004438 [Penicillium atrosanguineum]|uniref:Uncharacterized protein n=2 Tax=Penicillium atrosanguineum TaxID=1132637 RepID=A0A9W9Q0B9_9EURO|nr:hypothetical protein N7476_004438 [Penicillium atrosanguineum]